MSVILTKRLKNTTANALFHKNSGTALASGYTNIDAGILYRFNDSELWGWFNSGSVQFNDGVSDYTNKYEGWHRFFGFAFGVPFLSNPDRVNGYVSKTVQEAIEETKTTAEGKSRYCVSCGFDGNASSGRYLEYNSNVDSNQSGFVVARDSVMEEQSLSVTSNSTTTFSVYCWTGSAEALLTTISLSARRTTYTTGLNISLSQGWELRVKCTSGSCSRPIVFQFCRVV